MIWSIQWMTRYTSPSILSPCSIVPPATGTTLSGEKLGLRETYLPLVSPFSPSYAPSSSDSSLLLLLLRLPRLPAEGERDMYLPRSEPEEDERERPRPRRRSGDEPREDGGVREGVRDDKRGRLCNAGEEGSSLAGSSSCIHYQLEVHTPRKSLL